MSNYSTFKGGGSKCIYEFVSRTVYSNQANIDVTGLGGHGEYLIHIGEVDAGSNNELLVARLSTDNGVSFDTAGNYARAYHYDTGGVYSYSASVENFVLTNDVGTGASANECSSYQFYLSNLGKTYQFIYGDQAGTNSWTNTALFGATYVGGGTVNAVRFYGWYGNNVSAVVTLYRINTSS